MEAKFGFSNKRSLFGFILEGNTKLLWCRRNAAKRLKLLKYSFLTFYFHITDIITFPTLQDYSIFNS